MTDHLTRSFFEDVRRILAESRRQAYSAVNFIMVEAYWKIGRRIVEEEQAGDHRAEYGSALLEELSRRLGDEFGKGFSVANLKNFRPFYLTFPDNGIRYAVRSELGEEKSQTLSGQLTLPDKLDTKKLYALRRELTWTHYRLIMRVKNPLARKYYVNEAADQNWSTRQLERNIKSFYYERLLSSQKKKKKMVELIKSGNMEKFNLNDFIKDPYVLEYLNLPESWSGHEEILESAIIGQLQHFLLELGKGFSFVGRQFRISTETAHFYIDLVFYNYLLKCFVLIDLKTTELTHQDIGQIGIYVRMFDDLKRGEDGRSVSFCARAKTKRSFITR